MAKSFLVPIFYLSLYITKKQKQIIMIDYTKFSDKDLLDITDAKINKGGIPLKAVQEVNKRGLRKTFNRTINSFDF
tara:strand:- start:2560 stop:2787 length:228 start_codon:yes stop_codon:yes gene_type:complete